VAVAPESAGTQRPKGEVMDQQNQVIKVLSGERFTPYALARKLKARAMLESATFDGGRARYSMLMVREAFRVYQRNDGIFFDDGDRRYRIRSRAKDILDVLSYFADQHRPPRQDFPFPAGGIGFLSYEFSRFCDTISFSDRRDPLGLPDGLFLFGHVLVIFDHYSDLLYLIGLNYEEHAIDLERALAETEEAIHDLNFNYLQSGGGEYRVEPIEDDDDRHRFELGVTKVKEEIVSGNLLQGVLSRRKRIRTDMPASRRTAASARPTRPPTSSISTSRSFSSSPHPRRCTSR
jgi:anthranilate synthase component 1